jgi:hypothetical protein
LPGETFKSGESSPPEIAIDPEISFEELKRQGTHVFVEIEWL